MKKKIISSEQLDYVASAIAHYTGPLDKIDVQFGKENNTISLSLVATENNNLWKLQLINIRANTEIVNIEELQQTSKDAFRFLVSKRYESGIKHTVAK